MKLSRQQEAAYKVLASSKFKSPRSAVTALEVVEQAKKLNPMIFAFEVTTSTAAACMVEVYRQCSHVHRVRRGRHFEYFFDNRQTTPRVIQPHIVVNAVKIKHARRRNLFRDTATKDMFGTDGEYLVVKKADGTNAGVLKDGILYDTLESLIASLNGVLKRARGL